MKQCPFQEPTLLLKVLDNPQPVLVFSFMVKNVHVLFLFDLSRGKPKGIRIVWQSVASFYSIADA
jgi:hypothetical protein